MGATGDFLSAKTAGIQAAMFELIWQTFAWVEEVYIEFAPAKCEVIIRSFNNPMGTEWDNCEMLVNEILSIAFEKEKMVWSVLLAKGAKSVDSRFVCILSPTIANQIADEVGVTHVLKRIGKEHSGSEER